MGLFSTVMATLACARCDEHFRAGVQFYTDDDSRMPTYEEGLLVPLPRGATYEGICEAYCEACMARWCADDRVAQHEAFADLLATGAFAAFLGTHRVEPPDFSQRVLRILRDTPLTPDEVRARGRIPPPRHVHMSFPAQLGDVVLFRDGDLIDWISPAEATAHVASVRARLAELGWPVEEWRDLPVTVDAAGLIRVG
jgi:hypothetical protein